MSRRDWTRITSIFVLILIALPGTGSQFSDAGTSHIEGNAQFANATVVNTTVTPAGLRLAWNETYIGNWTRTSPWPGPRSLHSTAYDSTDGVIVLFGGWNYLSESDQTFYGDTWIYDPVKNKWTEKSPAISPPGRRSASMGYDSANDVVILFGGSDWTNKYYDTWAYKVSTNTWKKQYPVNTPPFGGRMIYDSANKIIIYYLKNETWGYNLTLDSWTNINTNSAPPSRDEMSLAYDSMNGRTIMFGGSTWEGFNYVGYNDTWSYYYHNNTWTNLSPAKSPSTRTGWKGMTFDSVSNKIVLFGGQIITQNSHSECNETWIYDPQKNNWNEVKPILNPPFRKWHTIDFDPNAGDVILHGGAGIYASSLGDTWRYNIENNTWIRMTQAPSERIFADMTYDERNELLVLFGGYNDWTMMPCNDTWIYDTHTNEWTEMHPGKAPSLRLAKAMVYDSLDAVSVLFGGQNPYAWEPMDDTWSYDAVTNAWTNLKPASSPRARAGHTMAYDRANDKIVLFGGMTGSNPFSNDTWTYSVNSNSWVEKYPIICPPGRYCHATAYDIQNEVVLLFGGIGSGSILNDTWTYDLKTNQWTNMSPPDAPSPRYKSSMVYDGLNGDIVLLGGDFSENFTWKYNVSRNVWSKGKAMPGEGRRDQALASDCENGTIFLFGGHARVAGYNVPDGNTWIYSLKRYLPAGNHTSNPIDNGATAFFGALDWNAATSQNTSIQFQLRTAADQGLLNSTPFIGPDGTDKTFYNQSGQSICSSHDGSRWMQYKAYLSTSNPAETPVLGSVTINYNLLPSISILSPVGAENWTGTRDIAWNASDPDGDAMFIDIDLLDAAGQELEQLAYGVAVDGWSWQWDTSSVANGTYKIRLTLRDDNESIPLSVNRTSESFIVFHPHINEAPVVTLLSPTDGAQLQASTVNLTWNGSDPEKDTLHYRVFLQNASFGPGELPDFAAETIDPFHEATGLSNGTYYWTVVAFDGQLNSTIPDIRSFNVSLPIPNHAPSASLEYPPDREIFNITSVELRWNGSDPDGDKITYRVFLSPSSLNASSLPSPITTTNLTAHTASDLVNGTTYYWAVIPNDGSLDGPLAGVSSFSIDISKGNLLPDIEAVTAPDIYINEPYSLNISATDPDGDTLNYSLIGAPAGMTLNASTGLINWTPTQIGTFNITVKVMDAKGGYSIRTFAIKVVAKPALVKPTVSIQLANNSKVSKKVLLSGTATPGSLSIARVEIFLDGNSLGNASGTTIWSFELETSKLSNGRHTLIARPYDVQGNYNETSIILMVSNAAVPAKSEFPWWILGLVVVLAVGGVLAFALTRKKKEPLPGPEEVEAPEEKKPEAEDAGALPEEVIPPVPPVPLPIEKLAPEPVITAKAPAPPPTPVKEMPEPLVTTKAPAPPPAPTPKVPEPSATPKIAAPVPAPVPKAPSPGVIAKAPRPPVAPKVPVATAMAVAPEGFAVEDIFLMYKDGRLIQHTTRRLKADMDVDIMTSMLKAVQEFVKESIGMEAGAELGSMEYGDNKIILEKGKHTILAAVITGAEPEGFRDEMRSAVKNIEGEFAATLPNWDGTTNKLAGARRFLSSLGSYAPPVKTSDITSTTKLSLKSELEFYQGFVRLKVAVKNNMPTAILDAEFKLIYNRNALRLDQIEPENTKRGEEAVLGNVEPNEKKTVAFYLDPQICTESYLEGVLTFKDAHGNFDTLKMPRKLASVVCPILFTDENINTAMLKRMAVDELPQKDTKVFSIPAGISPQKAFEVAKAAVQHHDVRQVRELLEKDPFIGEAWYYGKAKGREDRIVIRTRALADKNLLEFFVASSSVLMLTGMLAELKMDLNKELDNRNFRTGMKQVTSQKEVEALGAIKTLLERASEVESADSEIDIRRKA